VDTAVEQGTEIGLHYDPLLAKIIAHADDRPTAVRKLVHVLREFAAQGVTTNREYLIEKLGLPTSASPSDEFIASVICNHIERTEHAQRKILPSIPIGYRNNPYPRPPMKLEIGGQEYAVDAREPIIDGVRHNFQIEHHGGHYYIRSPYIQRTVRRLPRYPRAAGAMERETANSPMPGQVLRILVQEGRHVRPGEPLVVLEAMKMEQTIKTTIRGVVKAVLVKVGDVVAPGQMLVEIESLVEPVEDANERTSGTAAASD
jgi:propionyl-CoA carboxylase alpha chain